MPVMSKTVSKFTEGIQSIFPIFTLYYVRNIKMTPISFRNNFYYLKKKMSLKKENYRIPFG